MERQVIAEVTAEHRVALDADDRLGGHTGGSGAGRGAGMPCLDGCTQG